MTCSPILVYDTLAHKCSRQAKYLTKSIQTQMDLGTCPHSHSTKLKTEYEGALKAAIDPKSTSEITYTLHDLLAIRNEYERNIVSFVDDCDRRIRAAQRRLEKTPEENNKTTSLVCCVPFGSHILYLIHAGILDARNRRNPICLRQHHG